MAVMTRPKMKRKTRPRNDLFFFFPFLPEGGSLEAAAACLVSTGSPHSLKVNSPFSSGASTEEDFSGPSEMLTVAPLGASMMMPRPSAEVLAVTVATALPQTGQNRAPSGKEAPQWVQYAIGMELFSVGTVLADEVEDEVEILVGDIDLVPFQALVDLYEVLSAAWFDAPDFVEH